jgi:hypothetical protein
MELPRRCLGRSRARPGARLEAMAPARRIMTGNDSDAHAEGAPMTPSQLDLARTLRPLLAAAGLLVACADSTGVQQLQRREDELAWRSSCALLTDDGSGVAAKDVTPPRSDADYRIESVFKDGKGTYKFFVRAAPAQQTEHPEGELALEIKLTLDDFPKGSARRDHFQTRDGAEHEVVTWGEADCESYPAVPPQWVLEKVGEPGG